MIRRLCFLIAFALLVTACTSTTSETTTTSAAPTTSPTGATTSTTEAAAPTTTIPNGPLPGAEGLTEEVRDEPGRLGAVTEGIRPRQFLGTTTVGAVTS